MEEEGKEESWERNTRVVKMSKEKLDWPRLSSSMGVRDTGRVWRQGFRSALGPISQSAFFINSRFSSLHFNFFTLSNSVTFMEMCMDSIDFLFQRD